jgi:hypothetical protein
MRAYVCAYVCVYIRVSANSFKRDNVPTFARLSMRCVRVGQNSIS